MTYNKPPFWVSFIFAGITWAMIAVANRCSGKLKKRLFTAAVVIPPILTIIVLKILSLTTGVDLTEVPNRNTHYNTPASVVLMVIIPVITTVILIISNKKILRDIPDGGTWYCEKLQMQLSFDENGSSFVVKDQKTIPGRLEIKDESKYLYLIAHDPLEGCVFSGKFLSRSKTKMEITNRSDGYTYSFVQK